MFCTNRPLVTIGIPFYNDELYLEKAILSVINQTFTDWWLILIDDGSTDNSLHIAQKYLSVNRIKILSDGLNKNLACRLNELINLCETKYLARMDADDIMHPNRIKTQLEILEKNTNIDVLGTNAYVIDKDDSITGIRRKIDNNCDSVKNFIHPSIMAKTEWYKQNKYDEIAKRMQDKKLWLYTADKSNFKATNIPLLYYREVNGFYAKKYLTGISGLKNFYKKETNKKFKKFWFKEFWMYIVKYVIYFILNLFNMEKILLQCRNLKLSKEQIVVAESNLKIALSGFLD